VLTVVLVTIAMETFHKLSQREEPQADAAQCHNKIGKQIHPPSGIMTGWPYTGVLTWVAAQQGMPFRAQQICSTRNRI